MYAFTRLTTPENVVASFGAGVPLVLNMDSDEVYELNPVSHAFWEEIEAHNGDAKAIFRSLLEKFDVAEDRLQEDLEKLITFLVFEGLLHAE